jgi:dihydroflavonol-4-reductase
MARLNLVTGGGGFIGSHVTRLLSDRGEAVRVLDIAGADGLPDAVEVIRGSILDPHVLRRAFAGVDRVYHLAADPNLWNRDPRSFDRINHIGTCRVLEEAMRRGVERFVHTSTETILKSCRRDSTGLTDEAVSLALSDMTGPYCRSKFLAEQECLKAARTGFPVVVVNPTLPIGPGDRHLNTPSRMLLGFLNGTVPAYLECFLNLVDVRDAAHGHLRAADFGQPGERYILGGENIRLSDLLQLLAELTGLPMPKRRVPYGLALAVAVVSEAVSRFTGRPPAAPLTGVRLVRKPSAFDCSKAVETLGLVVTPLRGSLIDAIHDFAARGLLQRRLEPAAASLRERRGRMATPGLAG